MNCPSCGTEAPSGATSCRRCGKALGAKAPKKEEESSPGEIELMPLEPSKAPAHSEFEPPAGLPPPPVALGKQPKDYSQPPSPTDPRPRTRAGGMNKGASKTNLYVGGAIALVILLYVGYLMLRTKHE